MTTANAILICKSLADKYGSPIVSDSDWVNYLNMAQLETLSKLTPDSLGGDNLNVETDYNTLEEVRPLIYSVNVLPSNGLITNASLAAALQSASGDSSCSIFRLLNINTTGALGIVRFIKHNQYSAYTSNVFKNFTTLYPGFTLVSQGYQLYPPTGLTATVTCIKTPKVLTNTGESPDFADYVMNQVLFTTLKLSGVQIRDEEIAFDIRNTGITSTQ
jgi:hypothetical protein